MPNTNAGLDDGALRGVLSITKVGTPKEVGMSRKAWVIGISAALVACVFGANVGFSEDTPPPRVRGTLDQISGLTVQTRSGAATTIQLKDGAPWLQSQRARCRIQKNSFVGIAAMPQAVEVSAFAEPLRGTPRAIIRGT
jgi:hypothetical protein